MKISCEIAEGRLTMTIEVVVAEEVGPAAEAFRGAARLAWPGLKFSDEPGFEPRKPKDFSRPPKPGSPRALLLETARRLKTTDPATLADALDLATGVAAMGLGMLRKGGHLKGIGK